MMLSRGLAAGVFSIALAVAAHAAGPSVPTVVHINVTTEINVDFELAGIDAVGFTHRPRTAKEHEDADRALETLRVAGGWIRFNADAKCHESASGIGGNIYRPIDPDTPKSAPKLTKPAIDVHFTFACDAMPALRTLDLGLIDRFPRVREVIADVRTPTSHHAEIVTTPTGTVSLVPK